MMRHALVLGLVFAATASAQRPTVVTTVQADATLASAPRLLDLSRRLNDGAVSLREQVERGEPRSGKLGKRILKGLLEGNQNRDADDPIYRELDRASLDLENAARELARSQRSRRLDVRDAQDAERRFVRQFRRVDRIVADIDRSLTAPTARGVFAAQVQAPMNEIRAEVQATASWRDHDERRDRRSFDRTSR